MKLRANGEFRLAVFSDIHGNVEALEAVLSDIKSRGGADTLVAAGDLLTEGPHPRETLEVLRTNNVQLLLGNHEEYLLGYGFENLRQREWGLVDRIQASNSWTLEQLDASIVPFLGSQPHSLRFGPDGLRPRSLRSAEELLVTHATPRSCHDRVLSPEIDYHGDPHYYESYGTEAAPVIAFGHFHQSYILNMRDGRRLVNVASVSMPYDRSHLAAYTLFQWDGLKRSWEIEQRRVNYRWDITARAMHECKMPEKDFMLSYFV
jgi:predicted phosphodiesterase